MSVRPVDTHLDLPSAGTMKVFGITIFVSAFLLFLVQPLIGKYILPWFGSTPSVWTTCVLFFQVFLLAGYGYAHLLTRLKPKHQVAVHAPLLLAAALLLPITPSESWKPMGVDVPTWRIMTLLAATVGIPYFMLSSSSPLLQRWYAIARSDRSPYRLYALSNAGSLIALLVYPFLVEPLLRLQVQTVSWSVLFALFAVLSFACLYRFSKSSKSVGAGGGQNRDQPTSPTTGSIMIWLGLSAAGSVMLLATIAQQGQDIPPVPFLFVLPLALYLITFIVAFDGPRWYSRRVYITCILPAGAACGTFIFVQTEMEFGVLTQVVFYSFALFACCMTCHGELARRKPAPAHLTLYYLVIAFGGAVGGFFGAVIAPAAFDEVLEYPIGLILSFGLVFLVVAKDLKTHRRLSDGSRHRRSRTETAKPPSRKSKDRGTHEVRRRLARMAAVTGVVGVIAMIGFFVKGELATRAKLVEQSRNFYGIIGVVASNVTFTPRGPGGPSFEARQFLEYHGSTSHGFQLRHETLKTWATTYYTRASGIGLAFDRHPLRMIPDRQFRIGVVGLGIGTIAAYANEKGYVAQARKQVADYLRFYEINPEVTRFARQHFTYLTDASERGVDLDVYMGDARLTMERQIREHDLERFDILAIDAFNGDAVPMHLLTDECFQAYLSHLAEGGILAFHVSSRMLNLTPVIAGLAARHGLEAGFYDASENSRILSYQSRWVLVSANDAFWNDPTVITYRNAVEELGEPVVWTDDFSSLLQVIK